MRDDRWLSHCREQVLEFYCHRCEIRKLYDADRTLAQQGDRNLAGMCVHLAEVLNCPRVYTPTNADPCWMKVRTHTKPRRDPVAEAVRAAGLNKAGMYPLADRKVRDLAEWEELFAHCACGRTKRLNRERLLRDYGHLSGSEVAKMLRCRHCGSGRCSLAVTTMAR